MDIVALPEFRIGVLSRKTQIICKGGKFIGSLVGTVIAKGEMVPSPERLLCAVGDDVGRVEPVSTDG